MHQRVDEREVAARTDGEVDVRQRCHGRTPRVHGNELCPAFLGRRDAGVGQRVLRRRVGTDHEDGVGEADFLKAVGGRPGPERCSQTGYGGAVSEARAVIDIRRTDHGAGQFGGKVVLFVGAARRGEHGELVRAVRAEHARRCSAMAR